MKSQPRAEQTLLMHNLLSVLRVFILWRSRWEFLQTKLTSNISGIAFRVPTITMIPVSAKRIGKSCQGTHTAHAHKLLHTAGTGGHLDASVFRRKLQFLRCSIAKEQASDVHGHP